jgi:HlyD family secretion protein
MNLFNGNYTNGNHYSKIRLLIVDDQATIREAIKAQLEGDSDFEVVGMADNGQKAIEKVESLHPDVVLIDMEMPVLDGVAATRMICEQFKDTRVLVLSSYDNEKYITQSLDAGAKGYLIKGTPSEELKEAIWSVYRGYVHIGPGLFDKIVPGVRVSSHSAATGLSETSQEAGGTLVVSAPKNGAGKLAVSPKSLTLGPKFDKAVVLRQSKNWSRAIVWTIIGVTTAGVIWACFAKIEQVVLATGQLKPEGTVKEIQAPVNGVVEKVHVKDGDHVKEGQVLVSLDATASQSQLVSYKKIRQSLVQENQFYRTLMEKSLDAAQVEQAIARLKLPKEVAALARNRSALVAENELFQVQLANSGRGTNLTGEQAARLQSAEAEANSRAAAARLEMEQLQKQLIQNQVKLADARGQVVQDKIILEEIKTRNQKALSQAEKSLNIDRGILSQIEPLLEEGALGKYQVEKQRQAVSDRVKDLAELKANGQVEYKKQLQQTQAHIAEIGQLIQEEKRLNLAINQAQERFINTKALTQKDVRDRVAENQKKIAEIDSQITKLIVENDKKIAETDSQISQAQVTIKYQELRAPVSGTVFDLKASPGYVPPPTQKEPILKIVPDDHLIAEVDITNKDIGFVRTGMKTDVRIDTFPFSEFGDIKGEVISIGSDALPPDEIHKFYRFPAKVKLNQQVLKIKDGEIPLQSGMSVSANIKINENRTVMSLFTEMFTKSVEPLKTVR